MPETQNIWLQKDTQALASDLDRLTNEYGAIGERLDQEGNQQENFVKIERHLASPLVAAATRNSLRERYLAMLVEKYQANKQPLSDAKSDSTRNGSERTEKPFSSDLLDRFPNHPFVELLKTASEAPAKKSPDEEETKKLTEKGQIRKLAEQGELVRLSLAELPANIARSVAASRKELEQVNDRLVENPKRARRALELRKIAEVRRGRSEADSLVRAAASMCNLADSDDPTPALRNFDLHQLMLWQCQRSLDDFWGPKDSAGKYYFEAVAQQYLEAAKGLLLTEPHAAALRAHCTTLLAGRLQAAEHLPNAASKEDLSARNRDLVQLPLFVRPGGEDLPRGIAAAFVRYNDGKKDETVPLSRRGPGSAAAGQQSETSIIRRFGVPIDTPPGSPAWGIVEQKADQVSVNYWFKPQAGRSSLEGVVCFRGHERPAAIEFAPPGVQIVYEPKRPVAPTVRVRGDEKVPTSVMFIFDCSYSMKELDFILENQNVRRIDGARQTLINILKFPSLQQFSGVGLRIYGHRFNYYSSGKVATSEYALSQRKAAADQGRPYPQLLPGADVELTFPTQFLDEDRRNQMIATLGELNPHGQTPLYLAISQAANDPLPRNERRRIIAITDGFNLQTGAELKDQMTATRLEELLAPHSKITLDIIGFGSELSRKAQTKAKDLADMKRIASKHGGSFYQATDARDLLDRILKSLSLGKFEVVPAGSPAGDIESFQLENETWRGQPPTRSADDWQRRAQKYNVRVTEIDSQVQPSMPIGLEGGEAIELFLERAGNAPRLTYRYYYGSRKVDPRSMETAARNERLNLLGRILPPAGAASADPDKHWVASFTPKWESQEKLAKFFISIQNHDLTKFSPRPADAWIEITPLNESGEVSGPITYRFCDLAFLPGQPVPVLECNAWDFPYETCKRARIKVWFSMASTSGDPANSPTVAELKQRGALIDGVRISCEVIKEADGNVAVRVREQRPENDASQFEPGRVKIQMSPAPLRAEHDYDARRHTFYFEPGANVDNSTVRLTSVKDYKQRAISGTLPDAEIGR